MSGFNDLFIRPVSITTDHTRHIGYGHVNQWHGDDNTEVAEAMLEAGLNATLLEFLGFGKNERWRDLDQCFDDAEAAHRAFTRRGVFVHWTAINWNIGGGGVSENGSTSICDEQFDDAWWGKMLDFFARLLSKGDGSLLPCAELGCRNKDCRNKGLGWHNKTLEKLGAGRTRWNGNGDASPSGAAGMGILEYHPARIADTGYPKGSLVVPDHSAILNELGGLRNYASNTEGLQKCAQQAKDKGCGFVHYGFSTDDVDYGAINALGEIAK